MAAVYISIIGHLSSIPELVAGGAGEKNAKYTQIGWYTLRSQLNFQCTTYTEPPAPPMCTHIVYANLMTQVIETILVLFNSAHAGNLVLCHLPKLMQGPCKVAWPTLYFKAGKVHVAADVCIV